MKDFIGCSIFWGIIALIAGVINHFLQRIFSVSPTVSPAISFFLALTLWFIGLFAFMIIHTKMNK